VALKNLAEALNHPESEEWYQRAKAALNYWQMKGQFEATEAQREAIEVQREAITVQKASIAVQKGGLGVQKAVAAAEAKAADASIKGSRAAERNAKYLLWSEVVPLVRTVFPLR
jgi:hypothetical protein